MDYADQIMSMFKEAAFFSPVSKDKRKLAQAMAPGMAHMGGADLNSARGYMGDIFKSNSRLRGILAGERGATQRQNIAGEYNLQLQNMRGLFDKQIQGMRNLGLLRAEQERGYNDENMARLYERQSKNRVDDSAFPGGRQNQSDFNSVIWENILDTDGSVRSLINTPQGPVNNQDDDDDDLGPFTYGRDRDTQFDLMW